MDKRVIVAIVSVPGRSGRSGRSSSRRRRSRAPAPVAPAPTARRRRAPGRAAVRLRARPPRRPAGGGGAGHIGPSARSSCVTPDVRFVFSSRGGTLVHAKLRAKQFLDEAGDPNSGHDVVRTADAGTRRLRIDVPESGFPTPADGAWEVEPAGAGHGRVRRRQRQRPHREALPRRHRRATGCTWTSSSPNRGDAPVDHNLAIAVTGRQDPEQERAAASSRAVSANVASAVCCVNDKIERESIEKLDEGRRTVDKRARSRWVATDEKFFLLAAVPYPETPDARTCACARDGHATPGR